MKQTLKIVAVSALVTAAIIKAAPALADPAPGQNVSVVHTADLDLATAAGRQALDHRLVSAAFDVCGTASDGDLSGRNEVRLCRATTLGTARAEGQRIASRGDTITVAAAR